MVDLARLDRNDLPLRQNASGQRTAVDAAGVQPDGMLQNQRFAPNPGTEPRVTDTPHTAADMPLPGGDFRMFVTRLSFQGLLSLGLLENPVTGTKQKNLPQAKLIYDDLVMLQEKTVGNLEDDEQAHLDKVVGDLRAMLEKLS